MTVHILVLATTLFAGGALADDPANRASLSGTWQVQNEVGKGSASVWVLEKKSDVIHVTNLKGDQKLAISECNTVGRECEIEDSGRQAKVSMWFIGPKLVELETRGEEVVKRRFSIAGQGDICNSSVVRFDFWRKE